MSEKIVTFDNLGRNIKLDTGDVTSVSNINGIADKTMDVIIEYIKKSNYKLNDNSDNDQLVSSTNRNRGEKRFNIKIENSEELTKLCNDISYIMDKVNNEVCDLVVKNNLENRDNINEHIAKISVIPTHKGKYSGWTDPYRARSDFSQNLGERDYPLCAVNVKIVRDFN